MPTLDAARRRRVLGFVGAVAGLAVVATLAVIWPGYDARQTPVTTGSVWALQNGAGSAYARVNLALGEVDTVKQVENGSAIAQTADRLFVFSDAGTRFADVDLALPVSLTAESGEAMATTPAGTVEIATAADYLVFRTDSGEVYSATLSGGGDAHRVSPDSDDATTDRFVADTVTVDDSGTVFAVSAAQQQVLRADARTGRVLGIDRLPESPTAPRVSAAHGQWVVLDSASGDAWIRDRADAVATGATGEVAVQSASATGDDVFIADSDGLVRVSTRDATATRVFSETLGTPVAPVHTAHGVVAGWLGEGAAGGSLWIDGRRVPLDYGTGVLEDDIDAVFVTNGDSVALNERRSGWVWTVPDGRLLASSQQWRVDERTEIVDDDELVAERMIDPRPPVAVDDVFGVRAGSLARLPVLLNDHDPNEDVLSIDPTTLQQPDGGWARAQVTGAEQEIVLQIAADAAGSTSLTYRTTDGTASDGLYSTPATVSVSVVPDEINTPPVWCGAPGCRASWPQPTVAAGGTLTIGVMSDWVDPEGDPFFLARAHVVSGTGAVTTDPSGTLTYQHPDAGVTDSQTVLVQLIVADVRGATTTRELAITVTPSDVLTATSFAVAAVVGEPVILDFARHVSGASGPIELVSAVTLDETRSTVTTNVTGLNAAFTATQPGSFLVQYMVRGTRGEASAVVRVVVREAAQVQISTPPLTAFVRPGEDATVDVLEAVHNPAGLVLLVSDLQPRSDPFASVSVDVVGHNLLRVRGTTDDGNPGLLGVVRYTISDGTGSPESTAEGELTVVLLPAGTAEPPIATDDAVTVRAGDQIDIPVMDNDTAAAGALIAIDPASIVNESGGGLAFATPRVVRYFAPTEPGVYGIGYTIYRLGFPEATDTARVTVTVTGDETNRAPRPSPLAGRVLSGESVRVPFSSFGVDPDGDTAVLDRVLTQPDHGSAVISAEGDAIVYTSPSGFRGQVRFTYQVRDARGETGSAEVRVGVLDALTDASPVTFSDYLQIQAGATTSALLHPTENDTDPAGGRLELVTVTPNAPVGTVEYARLAERLGPVKGGSVVIFGGTELGTSSYTYTVRGSTGDTASGLIVVKVVRDRVPDVPIVTDTVLTVETRAQFSRGIDVLSGKVSWTGGDASTLTLSVWGQQPDVQANGRRLSGALREVSRLIPFTVSGTAFDGSTVTSYGFLRVPGARDVRLSLRAGTPPLAVAERASADLDLATVVAVPAGQRLQVVADGVRAGGARADARCTSVTGTVVRYDAGAGAPWADTCVVPVRLSSADEPTYLTVRVSIEAEQPQPVLRGASLTVSPGQSADYDLRSMVTWTGREDPDALRFATTYNGDQFVVAVNGPLVRVTAAESARPGRDEPVTVTLPSHPEASPALLNLTVGPAPSTLPRGGVASAQCSQAGGATSCTFAAIGTPGEVNPLDATSLRLVSVSGSDNCSAVDFSVEDASTLRATWSADRAGAAECTGSFVVEDAQGRRSSGERDGRIVLDLQGLPAAPTRVEWTAFAATTVTLRAISDAPSHPAVTGYDVTRDGQVVATCPISGLCPEIEAPVGVPATYAVRAVNDVGGSRTQAEVSAWPYRSPAAPAQATFTPVPAGETGGVATITVTGLDDTTGSVRLAGGRGGDRVVSTGGRDTVVFERYDVGGNQPVPLTATPLSGHPLPPIPGGATEGSALTFAAHGVGAPRIQTEVTADEGRVTVSVNAIESSAAATLRYGFSTVPETCRADGVSNVRTFDAPLWEQFTVYTCAQSVWSDGTDGFGTAHSSASIRPVGTLSAPPALTYAIEPRPERVGDDYEYRLIAPSEPRAPHPDVVLVFTHNGERLDPFALPFGVVPGALAARWCDAGGDETNPVCSAATPVTARGAHYPVRVAPPDVQCSAADSTAPAWQPQGIPADDVAVAGTLTRDTTSGTIRVRYDLTWQNRLAGLRAVSFTVDCVAAPPTPTPTPPGGTR